MAPRNLDFLRAHPSTLLIYTDQLRGSLSTLHLVGSKPSSTHFKGKLLDAFTTVLHCHAKRG